MACPSSSPLCKAATMRSSQGRASAGRAGAPAWGAASPSACVHAWPCAWPGASPDAASEAASTIDPSTLSSLPDEVREGIVTAYADALAPVFWYLVPFIVLALLLSLFLKQIPLSDQAGLVARGEAISGEEAERLEAEQRGGGRAEAITTADAGSVGTGPTRLIR